MSKYFGMVKQPVRVVLIAGIVYLVAVAVKAAYFVEPWYKFW